MLALLAKTLKALNSDASPIQLALALALAMLVAFNSLFSLLGVISIFFLFLLRVNFGAFFLGLAIFSILSLILNNAFISVGEQLLTSSELGNFWTALYQCYWFRLFELNNTLVMGALICSIVLFIPVTVFCRFLVIKYRESIMTFVNKFKVVQTLKASKFYQIYDTVKS